MVLGRLTHYAFDALAISTVLAGVKKQTGFGPATEQIPDSSIRTFANAYFGTGETIFNIISGTVVSSSYFEQKLQGTGPVYGERKTGL